MDGSAPPQLEAIGPVDRVVQAAERMKTRPGPRPGPRPRLPLPPISDLFSAASRTEARCLPMGTASSRCRGRPSMGSAEEERVDARELRRRAAAVVDVRGCGVI